MGDVYKIHELGYLSKSMDMAIARQNAGAGNVANASTPGYKAIRVEFEEQLKMAMGRGVAMTETHPAHLPNGMKGVYGVKPRMVESNAPSRLDGNNVDLDKEFTINAVNTVRYEVLTTTTRKHLAHIFEALKDKGD